MHIDNFICFIKCLNGRTFEIAYKKMEVVKMKMSKEDKIRIIIDALDEVIPIPNHKEERIKDVLRKALRAIEEKESEDY